MAEVSLEWLLQEPRKSAIKRAAELLCAAEKDSAKQGKLVNVLVWIFLGFYSGMSPAREEYVTLFHLSHFMMATDALTNLDHHLKACHVPFYRDLGLVIDLSRLLLKDYCHDHRVRTCACLSPVLPKEMVALVVAYLPVAECPSFKRARLVDPGFLAAVLNQHRGTQLVLRADEFEGLQNQFSLVLTAVRELNGGNEPTAQTSQVDAAAARLLSPPLDLDEKVSTDKPKKACFFYIKDAKAKGKASANHALAKEWNRIRFLPEAQRFYDEAKVVAECERAKTQRANFARLTTFTLKTALERVTNCFNSRAYPEGFSSHVLLRAWQHVLCRHMLFSAA